MPSRLTDVIEALTVLSTVPVESWLNALDAQYAIALVRWLLLMWMVARA